MNLTHHISLVCRMSVPLPAFEMNSIIGGAAMLRNLTGLQSRQLTRRYRVSFLSTIKWQKSRMGVHYFLIKRCLLPKHSQWTCFYSAFPNYKHSSSSTDPNPEPTKKRVPSDTSEIKVTHEDISDSVIKSDKGLQSDESNVTSNFRTKSGDTIEKDKTGASHSHGVDVKKKVEEDDEHHLSIFQRFRSAYQVHGKTLVGVHVATSLVWFGSFYYAAASGVDIVAILKGLGFSDKIISPFTNSQLGNLAVAYLMYKIATPARYTVTLAGTNYAIKYLKKTGRIQQIPEGDSLRELMMESKDNLQETTKEWASKFEEKTEKLKQDGKEYIEEKKEKFREKK